MFWTSYSLLPRLVFPEVHPKLGNPQQLLCRYSFRAGGTAMEAISLFSLRRTLSFLPPCVSQHLLHLSTVSYCFYSLTAILVSRFLIDLQEANLRSVKVDSDDPAYISSHSENSLPSFVVAPGTTRPALGSRVEHCAEPGVLDNGETGEANNLEDETLGMEIPHVEV